MLFRSSVKALDVAKGNAERNGVGEKIEFVESDAFEKIDGIFDVLISNPPYIPTADIKGLDKEVKDHDPHIALDGGDDGLDFYRTLGEGAYKRLTDGGRLIVECGQGQAREIVKMWEDRYDCRIVKDMQGVERIVSAVKKIDGKTERSDV